MTVAIDLYFPKFSEYLSSVSTDSALSKIAALGTWQVDRRLSAESAICESLGGRESKGWPLAAYSRLGEGLELTKGTYFLVHPAHFALQRDHFVLDQTLTLESGVSSQLVRMLNKHFADDGLYFERSNDPAFWYLTSHQSIDVKAISPAEVVGRDVRGFMPQGPDTLKCQTIINQVQMLLHDHPVNEMRELVGQLPVNSIWLSGRATQDDLRAVYLSKKWQIFANDALTQGLAKNAKQTCYVLPRNWQLLIDSLATHEDALVVVNHANTLEQDWFEPMWQSLSKGVVKQVNCHFGVGGMTFSLSVHARDKWKFWRAERPFVEYFELAYGKNS